MKFILPLLCIWFSTMVPCSAQLFKWASGFGSTNTDVNISVATDANGNVLSTGYFLYTVDFDPGPGVTNLVDPTYSDAFVRKLDANGNLVWVKQIGGAWDDYGTNVKTDAAGNVYVMGVFRDTVDFDPGAGVFKMGSENSTYYSTFLLKLDASGNFVWATQRQSPIQYLPYVSDCDLELDNNNNIYFTYGYGDSGGSKWTFIEKANSSGVTVWGNTLYASGSSGAKMIDQSIAVSSAGDIILTGSFDGSVDFNPGGPSQVLTAVGQESVYILKMSNSGNFIFAKKIDAGFASAYDVVTDPNGDIYVCGRFGGTGDFDPGPAAHNVTAGSSFGSSMYLLKLLANGNFAWVNTYGDGGSNDMVALATDASGNVYSTGSYVTTCYFSKFPTSVVFNSNSDNIFVLKVDPAGSYVWAREMGGAGSDVGCGITVTNTGDVYTVGSFTLTANFDFKNPNGHYLTSQGSNDGFIHKSSVCPVVDTSVSKTANTLTANDNNATYQWINCATQSPITGATGKSYTPTVKGDYAVIVNKSGCTATSSCYTVAVGIRNVNTISSIVYPNPTTGDVHISLDKVYQNIQVEITSAIGQVISKTSYNNSQSINTKIDGADGLYYMTVVADGAIADRVIINKVF